MDEGTRNELRFPEVSCQDALTGILRQGAQQLLAQAIEAEVADYVEAHGHLRNARGHRLVVRNGHKDERDLQTGVGPLKVRQPRVDDRRIDEHGQRIRFTSSILPPYLRRTRSIEELIPWLYLKGISTGDFSEALMALLGPDAPGLSASTVVRLKEVWQRDYAAWSKRSLVDKRYVYFWVDGIHFNVRLEEGRQCILIVMGATPEGRKELVAVQDGLRESEQSWRELLLDLKARGLAEAPKLAVGDGALGFWGALEEAFPQTREQRCWVHKTANLLDKLPKSLQPQAKAHIHEMYLSPGRAKAHEAYEEFLRLYGPKYPKACECLKKDKDVLFTFYDFPAEHWGHLRTTNPIESTFARVRHRTRQTKGCGSRLATLSMVFQLVRVAEKHWRRLNGNELLARVIAGVTFIDGVDPTSTQKQVA